MMVPELRDLLNDAAEPPDSDSVDTDVLLSSARRRVVRRRNSTIAGAALGVAAVALVAAVITQVDLGHEAAPTAPAPSVDADLSSATMAKPGEDYRVVTEYDIEDLAKRGGQLIESATPGGLLVYRIGHDGRSDASEIGLLNPENGARTPLPQPIADTGASRVITSKNMIAGASFGEPGAGFWYFDPATQNWNTFTLAQIADAGISGIDPAKSAISRIQFGTDNVHELWLSIGPADDLQDRDRLVSVDLADQLNPVDHGEVSLWAMATGTLAYLPPGEPDSDTMVLRDIATGDQRKITVPHTADECTMKQLWMRSDRLMAREDCRAESGGGYSLFQQFSDEGEPLRAVTGTQFDVLVGSNKLMLLRSQSPEGLFLYDIDTGKVLRLTKHLAPFTDLGASEGDRWVFLSPIDDDKGVRVRVAEFR